MTTLAERRLLENLSYAVVQSDLEGLFVYVNQHYTKLTGFASEELLANRIWSRIVDGDVRDRCEALFYKVVKEQPDPSYLEVQTSNKAGQTFYVRLVWSYLRDDNDDLSGLLFFIEELTRSRELSVGLARSIRQYKDLFENSRDALLIIEAGKFVECNRAALHMLGYNNKQTLLRTHPSELSPEYQPDGRSSLEAADDHMRIAAMYGSHRFEWVHKRANGEVFPVEVTLISLIDERGVEIIHTVWRDITEQKYHQDLILQQAHFDNLTNLPNRFLLHDRLQKAIDECERSGLHLAVFFLDLDNFKNINDSLGHDVGDQVLVEAASRLTDAIRRADTVGRLGGDEFLVIASDLQQPEDASYVALNILRKFHAPFVLPERELLMTASIGIACYPNDGINNTELLQRADMAIYHSKGEGKNRYHFFTESMNDSLQKRLRLEEQLHGALARGEFEVLFQPIIDLRDCQIIGAEALLRWHNPHLGSVSPAEFVPVLEHLGHIGEVGLFVLRESLQRAAAWRQRFEQDFSISVNVSPNQLKSEALIEGLLLEIQNGTLPASLVQLEITEGVLMTGGEVTANALRRFHKMGVHIALDDFGTGYSSMSYLRKYPFTALKIDQSFTCDVMIDPADRELVNAIVAMGKALGLKLVVEGVETREQSDFFVELGCEYGQGYLYGRPLSSDQFVELVESRNNR